MKKVRGIICVISGFIWMTYVGSHFMVGNIAPYVESYFEEADEEEAQLMFSKISFVSIFANFTGCQLIKRRIISPRMSIFVGGVVGIGGSFACSYIQNWMLFSILFPLVYGFMVGFTYMTHLYVSWQYIPGYEGLLTGLINAGFGLGGFVFTNLSTNIMNPDGTNANKDASKPFPPEIAGRLPQMIRLFCYVWSVIFVFALVTIQPLPAQGDAEEEIQQSTFQEVPRESETTIGNSQTLAGQLNRTTSHISTERGSGLCNNEQNFKDDNKAQVAESAGLDIEISENQWLKKSSDPEENIPEQEAQKRSQTAQGLALRYMNSDFENNLQKVSLFRLLKTPQFLLIFSMSILSVLFGFFWIGSSKVYGNEQLQDEKFVTIVASIASVAGVFRFVFAMALDKLSYKPVYTAIVLIQIIFAFTLPAVLQSKEKFETFARAYFLVAVSVSQLLEGAHFVLMPTVLVKLFGTEAGMRVFSVGFGFVGFASIINVTFVSIFLNKEGPLYISYEGIIYIYGSFSVCALLLLYCFFKENRVSIK